MSRSWSSLLWKTIPTLSTMIMFGQSCWLAITARIVDNFFSIYTCVPATAMISQTSTWSLSPCSSTTLLRTCSTWSSSFLMHCTASGATSWLECRSMERTRWSIVTLGSSRAWFDLLLTRCCTSSAHHIKSILSSRFRPSQSWTTFGSNSHTIGRYFCGHKTIL